jgi:hypothetical protein
MLARRGIQESKSPKPCVGCLNGGFKGLGWGPTTLTWAGMMPRRHNTRVTEWVRRVKIGILIGLGSVLIASWRSRFQPGPVEPEQLRDHIEIAERVLEQGKRLGAAGGRKEEGSLPPTRAKAKRPM